MVKAYGMGLFSFAAAPPQPALAHSYVQVLL